MSASCGASRWEARGLSWTPSPHLTAVLRVVVTSDKCISMTSQAAIQRD